MKRKLILILCAVVLNSPNLARSQSRAEVVEKFGQPTEAYAVSERIWMTPEFSRDGQVCSMRLYPARISSTTNYLQDRLDYWELKTILDILAPPPERGKKTFIFGLINRGGGREETTYSFENVTFKFLKSLSPYITPIKTQTTPPKRAIPRPIPNEKSEDEMLLPTHAEIVTIIWNSKPCGA